MKNGNNNNLKQRDAITKFLYNQFTFILAIIGVVFGIYFTFANPARLLENRVNSLESNIASYKEMKDQLDTIQKNDLHTLDIKIEANQKELESLRGEIIKLQTIIEERIPRLKK